MTDQSANCRAMDYRQFLLNREKLISAHAEWYWLLRGCPEGSPEVDWFRAEREVDQEFLSQIDLGLPV